MHPQLGALPDETLVYSGHEYTKYNLMYGLLVEPKNQVSMHTKACVLSVCVRSCVRLRWRIVRVCVCVCAFCVCR